MLSSMRLARPQGSSFLTILLIFFCALATALPSSAIGTQRLGAVYSRDGSSVTFRVYSSRATRLEVWIYPKPFGAPEKVRRLMEKDPAQHIWHTTVRLAESRAKGGAGGPIYYGYRAWGPNWIYNSSWKKGSSIGFLSDVDKEGNRFNPNKLLLDPYALEASHDPQTPRQREGRFYASGPQYRALDSGSVAPKGIVLHADATGIGLKPTRAFKDDIIYEVHVRGLTRKDPSVPAPYRGTYRGAGLKADYLQALGVTAIELLPVQETQNDTNDVQQGTAGDNYWGYSNYNYFAPDRRYAFDKSAGGPTREWKAMVRAFHARGIKVYIDVVYNHTGEGALWDGTGDVANILSWRGLDNPTYYELTTDNRYYWDNTGVGGNFNTANPIARNQILDSLLYWKNAMGVDGFRFDLASVLGNAASRNGFRYDRRDPANALNRAAAELPVRPAEGGNGVDLIAEPWGIGEGTYQLGNFPAGWAEWNGRFRDTFRKSQNKLGVEATPPAELAKRFGGSPDLYADDGRKPWSSVNFLVAHDGFTLRDLYAYNSKQNNRPWPFGPSDGGEDNNLSWDQGGDTAMQRQAARNGLAAIMLSAGVPMITGGDEMYRTQYGNNNAYNLDSDKNWLDYAGRTASANFFQYARKLMNFRRAHPALRPAEFRRGADRNRNGFKDITWLRDNGAEADAGYRNNANNHFLAYQIDGSECGDSAASLYIAYNGGAGEVTATLPTNLPGKRWYRVADTAASLEKQGNFAGTGQEPRLATPTYTLAGRSFLILIEK
jgi:isoamylase